MSETAVKAQARRQASSMWDPQKSKKRKKENKTSADVQTLERMQTGPQLCTIGHLLHSQGVQFATAAAGTVCMQHCSV
jgi:hypothetical protein